MTGEMRRLLDDANAPDDVRTLLGAARQPDAPTLDGVWDRVEASVAVQSITGGPRASMLSRATIAKVVAGALVATAIGASLPLVHRASTVRVAPHATLRAAPPRVTSPEPIEPVVPAPVMLAPPPASHAEPTPVRVHRTVVRDETPVPIAALPTTETPSATTSAPPSVPSAPLQSATLEDEIRLVADARVALSSDPTRALSLAEAHDRTFPNGALGHESEAVAIAALVALHRDDEAIARADRFLAAYPTSTSAPRIRSLREQAGAPRSNP